MNLISDAQQALDNIDRLQTELAQSPELVERLGLVHAWYVDTRDKDHPRFGFSKFVGYKKLDSKIYLDNYKDLDGRNTEWILKDFFDELQPGTTDYQHYHEELTDWLGGMGRSPRKKVRIMVLKPQFFDQEMDEDRRLLELLKAVVAMLPLQQRLELRGYL
ncbi:hypothetical protein [Ruegeria atlantica]|uniref:hypothetical protein n=1 Tax=Ruegeria atlantica TaxID=81569 RepID=UPI0014818FE9|nr:hypothetical protein [Ruegeria atlantica]